MTGKKLLKKSKDGKTIYGTAILSTSPNWPSVVKETGIDFVFLDTEHIPIGRTILSEMCHIYNALGLPPIVRIPSPDPFEACKALDGGAVGIIGPYIESAEQVRALVGATKLRPLKGKRLHAVLENREALEGKLKEYLENRNADNILIINIESIPAMENLDEILSVPGLDAVIIGPHDLSCSMGLPEQYHNPDFEAALQSIVTKVREKGLAVGVHFSETPDLQVRWAKAGVNIIMHSSDISIFSQALQRDIAEIRRALGEDGFEAGEKGRVII
ncbi:MAG: aldolase [Calditrichaeota bacterium]|nr:aldolase [Calditrichota bacterium]